MAHSGDQDRIEKTRNVPRFFVENPQVSWVLLVGVLVWGWFGYHSMPQRKDPDIPVRVAVASCSWPGATAQQLEQFVTRPIEGAVAENKTIHPGTAADYGIRSVSIPGYAYVYVQLAEDVSDVKRQFSDINLKLNALNSQLPRGAGPISFQSDFGDTAAVMLTIASPKADSVGRDRHPHTRDSIDHTDCAGRKEIQGARCTGHYRLLLSSISFLEQDNTGRRATLRAAGRASGNPKGTAACSRKRVYRSRWCLDRKRRINPYLPPDFLSDAVTAIRFASRCLGPNHCSRSSANSRAIGQRCGRQIQLRRS